MTTKCTEERFLRDIAQHKMHVLRDDGVNRHIRFTRDNSSSMRFDLITWSGHLCYTGDMGTYVFSRVEDMFEFFRTDREYNKRKGSELSINIGYWGEKLLSESRFGGYREFDPEYFANVIRRYRIEWIREKSIDKEQRRELWEDIEHSVLSVIDDGSERASTAAYDFQHRVGSETFRFTDLFDHDFTRATFHFVWCCFALAWGIRQYDDSK